MSHDYVLKMHRKSDDKVISIGYQRFLLEIDARDIPVCGAPMKVGGVPQVQRLLEMLKNTDDFFKVQVYFNGNLLLEV